MASLTAALSKVPCLSAAAHINSSHQWRQLRHLVISHSPGVSEQTLDLASGIWHLYSQFHIRLTLFDFVLLLFYFSFLVLFPFFPFALFLLFIVHPSILRLD